MKVYAVIILIFSFTLLLSTVSCQYSEGVKLSCESDIYCPGLLLHTVQMAQVFLDSKTFVDMKMKYPETKILKKFQKLVKSVPNPRSLSKTVISNFVKDNFEPEGSEFEPWVPTDWVPLPKFLKKIQNKELREFARELHSMWKYLGRQLNPDVWDKPEQYSMIYVPNPIIIPGGRFREFYYWDTYWINRGLLISQMFNTVRGIIANFLYMVRIYGYIPNGGRIYYMGRSQPPLLIPMVKDYLDYTKDTEFLRENMLTLEQEFNFWLTERMVEVTVHKHKYKLARFYDKTAGPRPESYREDYVTARIFKTEPERNDYYKNIKAAAESGRDFTSRWFISNGTHNGKITDTKCRSIIPVDLNAMLHLNAVYLANFSKILRLTRKESYYTKIADKFLEAVNKVLWHEDVGVWLDWDLINNKRRDYFYPSNIAPLWSNTYDAAQRDRISLKVIKYLHRNNVFGFNGGIPSAEIETGEQWDFPNAWAPLQELVISGLSQLDNPQAQELGKEIASKWVNTNFRGFAETLAMYEKYDARIAGAPGRGGEYENQIGFGWSNGVILDVLNRYPEMELSPMEKSEATRLLPDSFSIVLTFLLEKIILILQL